MNNLKYVFMVLSGGILYGTMSSFVKLSYAHGFNAAEISFWQAFVAAIVFGLLVLLCRNRSAKGLDRRNVLPLLLTGCAIGLTNFLYYESVGYIPASLAIVLLMQFTWFSLLLEWLLFHRKPSKQELVTVTFILVGTLMAGKVFEARELPFSMRGVMLAVSSSLTYAVYIVANGKIGEDVCWRHKSLAIMSGSSVCIFFDKQRRYSVGRLSWNKIFSMGVAARFGGNYHPHCAVCIGNFQSRSRAEFYLNDGGTASCHPLRKGGAW